MIDDDTLRERGGRRPARIRHLAFALVAFLVAAGNGAGIAQTGYPPQGGYGQQNGYPPQGAPQQGGLSLVGAWSWLSPGQGGMDRNTILFQPDNSFVRVSQLASGPVLRVWGQYRATQVGPSQMQLQSQAQGYLPQRMCAQAPGFPMRCQPAPAPPNLNLTLTFTSPTTFTAEGAMLSRDPQPYLLQMNVPAQSLVMVPAPTPAPRPFVPGGGGSGGGGGGGGFHTNIPGIGGNCDDMQQQRICSINNGHIITSGGCMKCIAP